MTQGQKDIQHVGKELNMSMFFELTPWYSSYLVCFILLWSEVNLMSQTDNFLGYQPIKQYRITVTAQSKPLFTRWLWEVPLLRKILFCSSKLCFDCQIDAIVHWYPNDSIPLLSGALAFRHMHYQEFITGLILVYSSSLWAIFAIFGF
mgnify:CR=1 FL=1